MAILGLKCKNCNTIHKYFKGHLSMQLDMEVAFDRKGDRVAKAKNIIIEAQGAGLIVKCPECGNSGELADIVKQVFSCDGCMKTIKHNNSSYCAWHGCNFCNTCFKDDVKSKYCRKCSERNFCKLYALQGGS